MRKFPRKTLVAGGLVATLAFGGAAFAFFSNSGGGTGLASVGQSSAITIDGTIAGTLYPAGAPATVSVDVSNPGGGSQYVGSVKLASITTDDAHSACDLSVSGVNPAFTMADI